MCRPGRGVIRRGSTMDALGDGTDGQTGSLTGWVMCADVLADWDAMARATRLYPRDGLRSEWWTVLMMCWVVCALVTLVA